MSRLVLIVLRLGLRRMAWMSGMLTMLFVLFASQAAYAQSYGSDNYSACSYGQQCPTSASEQETLQPQQHTVITTKNGLDVAVNLLAGQTIPQEGYVIYVTPLNGQGQSFQKVEFYIDDVLVYSGTPDSTGEVQWKWIPAEHPGTQVKIVVYSEDGTSIVKTFEVEIAGAAAQPNSNVPPAAKKEDGSSSGLGRVIENASEAAQSFIRALPTPVVYAIPYILFALLGIGILMALFQERRELKEAALLRRFVERDRQASDAKKSFVQLSSHYLRTPLAIMDGGISILGIGRQSTDGAGGVPVPLDALRSALQQLKQSVERSLGVTDAIQMTEHILPAQPKVWRRLGFWLPLACIGTFSFSFIYLANTAGALDESAVDWLVHGIVFLLLVILFYQALRHKYLRHADRKTAELLLADEKRLRTAQDNLVNAGVATMHRAAQELSRLIANLPIAARTKAIHKGFNQFDDVLRKLIIASQIRGTTSNAPFETTQIGELVGQATGDEANTGKKVAIEVVTDSPVTVQQPQWLMLVLKLVLDNAVAYSTEGGRVEVDMDVRGESPTITIRDHGTGMATEKLGTLFRPFERVEDATHFDRQGMGFSLYLCSLMMTHLGGEISAASGPGKGTVVTLTLPSPEAYT